MMQKRDTHWSVGKFFNDFNNSDQDFVIIGMKELCDHLQSVEIFDVKELPTFMIPGIKAKLDDPMREIVGLAYELIVLFTAKIPLKYIPLLYDEVFSVAGRDELAIRTQLMSVINEAIINAPSYSLDRQTAFTKYMVTKLITSLKNKTLPRDFALNLLTSTVETLRHVLTEQHITDLGDLIVLLLNESPKSITENIKYISSLNCAYSHLIPPEKLDDHIRFIKNKIEDQNISLFLLSNMVIKAYKVFNKTQINSYITDVFSHLNDDVAYNEEQELDPLYSGRISLYLQALRTIVSKEGADMSPDDAHSYISQVFYFLTFDTAAIITPLSADDEFDNEDEAEPDSESEISVGNENDSWRVRKSAIGLAKALINEQKDAFYETLQYVGDDENYPNTIDLLLRDLDNGVQIEALGLFRAIIHNYKDKLDPSFIASWQESIISQITNSNRGIIESFIDALTYSINELHRSPSSSTLSIFISRIKNNLVDCLIPTSHFIDAFLKNFNTETQINEVVKSIEVFANNSLSLKSSKQERSSALYIASLLFIFYRNYHDKCKANKEIVTIMTNLCKQVISISKSDGDIDPSSISTLGIFATCCYDIPTASDAVKFIIDQSSEKSLLRSSLSSLALIAATTNSSKLISSFTKNLLTILSENLTNVDSGIVYRSLWVIRLMINRKLITSDDCESFVDKLFDLIATGSSLSRHLATKNLVRINPSDSKSLLKLEAALTVCKLDEQTIDPIIELVSNSSKSSLDSVKPLVDALIKRSSSLQDVNIIGNISPIIGAAVGSNKDYGLSLIDQSFKDLNSVFSLQCIGQIGSYIDLSSKTNIVDGVFSLFNSDNPELFNASVECIGLMGVGSPHVILQNLLNKAQETQSVSYIFSMYSFIKKLNHIISLSSKSNKENIIQEFEKYIPQISNYLLSNINEQSEAAQLVSNCLGEIVPIQKGFENTLIQKFTSISIKGLSYYFEKFADNDTIVHIINQSLIPQYKENISPLLGESIISCIKVALVKKLAPKINNLFSTLSMSCKHYPQHDVVQHYGASILMVDIGRNLRSLSADCFELILTNSPECIDTSNTFFDSLIGLIQTETESSIIFKSLSIIVKVFSSEFIPLENKIDLANIIEQEESLYGKLEHTINGLDPRPIDFLKEFFNLLLFIRSILKVKQAIVEQFYNKYKNHEVMLKVRQIYSMSADNFGSILSPFTPVTACQELMEKLHPKATLIFSS